MPEKLFKVVVSGLSGRFPECDDVDTFREKLSRGDEFITVDNRKWPVGFKHKRLGEKLIPDATGKYVSIADFDQTVFKVNKTFARSSDITNRKILEPSFEAIVDAGINPYSLDGSNVSVFMSAGINEVDNSAYSRNMPSQILGLIGANKTMLSNRVSYALNLKGPSFTNYVDPHGGLDSLMLGYRYISEGLVDAAIVGVASSILDPRVSLLYHSYGVLCPDGVTRPFDEWANGYARSEGTVCFYLQRAEDAKRSYGEIAFCDARYLGHDLSNFINSGENYLKMCLQQLLEASRESTSELSNIAFLEMSACGHKTLDKIESNVVAQLLAKDRNEPLLVGSIKSNIGHVEAAAGLMGVLKVLLMLDAGVVVPNRNFQKPNEDIEALKSNQLEVVTDEKRLLPGNTVAVNSVSLFGTVGLAIIKQHEKEPLSETEKHNESFPRLLLICGRQENDLRKKISQIEKSPFNAEFISLTNDAFRQHMPPHIYRGYTVLPPPYRAINSVKERGDPYRSVWFIFSGMGSQWIGMGRDLLKLPLFAETVAKCDRVLRQKNVDIYYILTSDDSTIFDNIMNAFVGIITVQIGLYEVVKALGIKADGIIGHTVGENACAYADGCLSLEQAVLASWARGMASNEVKTIKGMMAAVGKGYADMNDVLPEDIQVACHNSSDSCTLTGPAESVQSYVQELKRKGVFARAVNVSNIAYHSKYIVPIAPRLLRRLEQEIKEPKQRSSRWISTSVPESSWGSPLARCCSAEYLTNNLLSPVLFEEGCKHIPENAICIEFAPHGLLQAILKRSLPKSCTNIPLTNRGKVEDNLNFLLSSIGMLYTAGLDPHVNNIFPAVEYPVSRGTPHISPYCTWYHENYSGLYQINSHHEDDLTMASELIPVCVRDDSDCAYLKDRRVDDNITIPQSFFLFLTWKMFLSECPSDTLASSTVVLENVRIHQSLIVYSSALDIAYASVMVQYGSGNFQVMLRDSEDSEDVKVILTGRIYLESESIAHQLPQLTTPMEKSISKNQFYNILEHCGYNLGEEFALVNGIQSHESQYKGEIMWNGNWVTFLDALMTVQMFANNNENVKDVVLTGIQRLEIPTSQHQSLQQGTVLPYSLDVYTKELLCSGVLMRASNYKTLPKPEAHISPFRFVPYPNPRCQDVFEFLHLCLQIAVENLIMSKYRTGKNGLKVFDMTGKYLRVIKQIIEEQNTLKSVIMMDAPEKPKANGSLTNVLIITDNVERLSEISTTVKNVFILLISPASSHGQQTYEQYFTELVQQSFSTNEFTLLKQKEQDSAREGNYLGLKKMNGNNGKVASSSLFSKNPNVEDVLRLINVKTDRLDERCLYIMDEGVNKEKLDQCMQKQSELGLCMSVLKQGELGSYRDLTQKSNQACTTGPTLKHTKLVSRISAGAKRVNYVCFDEIEDILSSEQSVGFSYVTALGACAQGMGLATTSPTGIPQYDSHLQWTVPTNCSSEEAATMLFFFAQAYKLLVLIPSHRSSYLKNVMINVGSNYLLAEAFIALSLYKNLEVFVTVDTDEDALLFRNRFPEIHHDHIFSSKNLSYYIQLKMRAEEVDLVVNCLSGIDHVETSFKCLAIEGIYIEVGTNHYSDSSAMGLEPFMWSKSFHVTQKRVSDLLQQTVERRRAMQKFIENCLNNGVIAPLKFDIESLKSTRMMRCNLEEETSNCKVSTIMYDEEHSYLIFATHLEDPSVLELIDWLVAQGACKFMVAFEKFGKLSSTEYRINRILKHANVHIQYTYASKFDDRREAGCLLEQIEKDGPLEAIFYLSIKSAGNKISNLNELVSPDVYFVGLSSAGLKEFEQRRAKGSPAILLHSDEPKDVNNALPRLNELLAQNDNNNAEILYHVTISESRNGHSTKIMNHLTFHDYLPHNIEVLSTIGEQENMMEPTFIEMSSLSRRYIHCKGVFPVFALPAINSLTLEPLFKRIQYPVFSATATSTNSVKEVAHKLYSSLKNIQPTGPITMISELWTLPLALELKSYAQRDGRRYRICILEGIPKIWSDLFKQLQSIGSEKFDAVCADEIFFFIEKTKKHYTQKFVPFEQNVQMLVESASGDLKTVKNVVRAAKKIKRIVTEVSLVQFPDEMLEHVLWFERCRPNDQMLKLSVTSKVIVVNEPTYRGLLNNTEVARAINQHAEFSWWEYSKPENGQR